MATEIKAKKRVVISYRNLPENLQELLKSQYPEGYTNSMIRVEKEPGNFFYAVILETDDVNYLVKVDVKIDDDVDEDDDKEYYDDEIKGADDIEESTSDDDDDSEM